MLLPVRVGKGNFKNKKIAINYKINYYFIFIYSIYWSNTSDSRSS